METKEGIIQRIKQDRKALAIENEWFNSFKPLSQDIQVGQEVKLTYSIKDKFKNIRAIEPITHEIPRVLGDCDEVSLTATDKNCILIVAKDLAISFKDRSLREWIKEVSNIREGL